MNPFENINTEINDKSGIRTRLEDEIKIFEGRILSVKREIDNLEGLIEINSFYSDKETNETFLID